MKRNTSVFNHSYFQNIDTPNKAYFLGFIYADGYIQMGNNKNLKSYLGLEITDVEILWAFQQDVGGLNMVAPRKNKNGRKQMYSISMRSNQIVADLIKLGVTTRKTFKLKQLPKIDESLIYHFIRGYFDGDGSVSKQGNWSVVGMKPFLNKLTKYLYQPDYIQKYTNCFSYKWNKRHSWEIGKLLYKDAEICLKRKFIRWNVPPVRV